VDEGLDRPDVDEAPLGLGHQRLEVLGQLGLQVGDLVVADDAPEGGEDRARVALGRAHVHALALGDPAQELVEMERLGRAVDVEVGDERRRQALGDVARLAGGESLPECLEDRAHGALGALAREVGLLLHQRDEVVVVRVHAALGRTPPPAVQRDQPVAF
jgi:hypothetical protein